jgi:hemolysin activation/secretion protein
VGARLPLANAYVSVRANLQWPTAPARTRAVLDRGRFSVRGYRENQVVRDSGTDGSVELHVPIPLPSLGNWHPGSRRSVRRRGLCLEPERGPFPNGEDQDLIGAGIGAQLMISSQLAFEVFWGASLADVDSFGEDSLQDHGVHLGLRWVQ